MTRQNKRKIKIIPLLTILIFSFIVLWSFGKYFRGLLIEPRPWMEEVGSPQPTHSGTPIPSPTGVAPLSSQAVKKAEGEASRREALWKKFREKFGEELKPEFDGEGCLVSVRGAPGSGRRGGTDFNPDAPQKAIARAREVVKAARELLCLQPDLPLESPVVKGNSISSQVTFRENHGGVPLEPVGAVPVDLGPQGELLSLYSDYVRDLRVLNEKKIDADQAKINAAAAISDPGTSMKVVGGELVMWVSRSASGGSPEGRYAYQYYVQGRQVIVDASNGEVIFRRDRRDF